MINYVDQLKAKSKYVILSPDWDNDWAYAQWGYGVDGFFVVAQDIWNLHVSAAVKSQVDYTVMHAVDDSDNDRVVVAWNERA